MENSLEITNKIKDVVLASEDCGIATLSIGRVAIDKDWDKKQVIREVDLMLRAAKKTKNSVVSLA